ncbi:MAG: acetylxylan esterase [Bacteroidetes bacterium]|nr:acetylxylan esterase [Bacteroidota bacterium]
MKKQSYVLLICCLFLTGEGLYAQTKPAPKHVDLKLGLDEENLNVLDDWITWNNPGSLLINHLTKQAHNFYYIRDKEIAQLTAREDWIRRQQAVKAKLIELVGPFPEKTPLNPIITGLIKKDGYRIEKIIFESMPGFYVTACLFIPNKLKGKAPAVLNVIGHEQESFRAELDQVIILNLVMKGIVVLAIDPLGQGEHVQYFDPKINFSSIGYSVIEHSYFGNQCFLSGSSGARYFTWDGIRAIDYLVSRKEVDPERIGVTGFSGGGTVTSYLAAFDDRVKVAVPSSWSTASRRQLETKGAQDAEAEFLSGLASGITFEDLVEVRAPKPMLMTFTSRDEYLSLQGAKEAYNEAGRAYEAFDKSENLVLVEDDSKHWLTPKIRLAIYAFFMKHFNVSGDPSEQDFELLTPEELRVTSTGQISTSVGGDMVFDANKRETEKLIERLNTSRKDIENHLKTVSQKAKEISGYLSPIDDGQEPFINGRYQRDGYTVTKYALDGEGDYVVPILLFVPNDNSVKHHAVVYLHPKGKIEGANPGGEIEQLVKNGYIVAATDVLGAGETKNTAVRGLAPGYTGVLIGRSIVGIQAGDIVRVVNYLKNRDDVAAEKVGAIAFDEMCLPLIHAAAFDSSINNITLIRSLISYRSVAMNRFFKIGLTKNEGGGTGHPYEVDFSWGIAGVLDGYDLPDLIGSIAPRKVRMVEPRDQMLDHASNELISEEMRFSRAAYALRNSSASLKIVPSYENLNSLLEWSFE